VEQVHKMCKGNLGAGKLGETDMPCDECRLTQTAPSTEALGVECTRCGLHFDNFGAKELSVCGRCEDARQDALMQLNSAFVVPTQLFGRHRRRQWLALWALDPTGLESR
jgi:hypothetical protein